MSQSQFAAQLKAVISDMKAKGVAAIYSDNLIDYLSDMEKWPDPPTTPQGLEDYKASLQLRIDDFKHQNEWQLEMFRSVIAAGQGAMKASFSLNGGAALAMLAFVGHLASVTPLKIPMFTGSMGLFALGVLGTVVTSGATYAGQWFYSRGTPRTGKMATVSTFWVSHPP